MRRNASTYPESRVARKPAGTILESTQARAYKPSVAAADSLNAPFWLWDEAPRARPKVLLKSRASHPIGFSVPRAYWKASRKVSMLAHDFSATRKGHIAMPAERTKLAELAGGDLVGHLRRTDVSLGHAPLVILSRKPHRANGLVLEVQAHQSGPSPHLLHADQRGGLKLTKRPRLGVPAHTEVGQEPLRQGDPALACVSCSSTSPHIIVSLDRSTLASAGPRRMYVAPT